MDQVVPFSSSKRTDQPGQVDVQGGDMIVKDADDKSNLDEAKYLEVSPHIENISVGRTFDPASTMGVHDSTPKEVSKWNHIDVLMVISIQLIVLILMVLLTMQYSWLHNVPHILSPLFGYQDIDSFAKAIANYNFVGVNSPTDEPSIFAVVLEVAIWSLAGVLARSEYYLSQIVVKRKQFVMLESISKLISDGAMGIAIAIAVILFLRATEFVNISLRNADVASIAAISFILGFYHEDTRRLLGSFRRKISESREESKENEDTD
jgi:hypothetical protein